MSSIENAENVLVVYDCFGDSPLSFYLINKKTNPEIFDIAIESDGIYINSNNKDGDASEKLNYWIEERGNECIFDYATDLIPANTRIIKTGFMC